MTKLPFILVLVEKREDHTSLAVPNMDKKLTKYGYRHTDETWIRNIIYIDSSNWLIDWIPIKAINLQIRYNSIRTTASFWICFAAKIQMSVHSCDA